MHKKVWQATKFTVSLSAIIGLITFIILYLLGTTRNNQFLFFLALIDIVMGAIWVYMSFGVLSEWVFAKSKSNLLFSSIFTAPFLLLGIILGSFIFPIYNQSDPVHIIYTTNVFQNILAYIFYVEILFATTFMTIMVIIAIGMIVIFVLIIICEFFVWLWKLFDKE